MRGQVAVKVARDGNLLHMFGCAYFSSPTEPLGSNASGLPGALEGPRNPKLEIRNPKSGISDPKSATRSTKHETRNPKSETVVKVARDGNLLHMFGCAYDSKIWHTKHETRDTKHRSLNPEP